MAKPSLQLTVGAKPYRGNGAAAPQEQGSVAVVSAIGARLVNPADRPADVVTFEEAMVGFFVEAADMLGVPKSVAAIYGICFASAESLGFSEIKERLEISSGSISQGLRVLREMGALKVVGSPLEKRDRFEPDMELRKLAIHFIERRLEKQLVAGKGRLDAIQAAVPMGDTGSMKELKARLKALQTWHSKGRALVPVMKTFLKLT